MVGPDLSAVESADAVSLTVLKRTSTTEFACKMKQLPVSIATLIADITETVVTVHVKNTFFEFGGN